MPDPSILREIKQYKAQLDDLLSKKYTDPTLVLGLNNVVQSKFEAWIVTDSDEYYDGASGHGAQKDFDTIKYFETLWSNFHYPIIKFFQLHHANYYDEVVREYDQSKAKDNFKPRPVEIRKINDNFVKFSKRSTAFYLDLFKHFSTVYNNSLVPNVLLRYFDLKTPANSIKIRDADTSANFLYLLHKCLLHLGNISRHRSFIEISYVLPCISLKYFHKFRLMKDFKKKEVMLPYYQKALDYYNFCILLIPALNEPYNHIGVICNFMGDKVGACYWFLRSQFTRIPTYKLGSSNMNSLFRKKWFLTNLYKILIESNPNEFSSKFKNRKVGASMAEELDIILTCLIGHFYMTDVYKINKMFIMKKLKYNKVEFVFLNLAFNVENFNHLINCEVSDGMNFYTRQLTLLMCFSKLVASSRFIGFVLKYIEMYLTCVKSVPLTDEQTSTVLSSLRLILHWIKEDSFVLKKFHTTNDKLLTNLVELLNGYMDQSADTSIVDSSGSSSQGSKYSEMVELLDSNSRPIRSYYFKEDVIFKDFSIIKFQFKDFKDDHLFEAGDINLLDNDYSSLVVGKFPSFLDNEAFLKMEKSDSDSQEVIESQVTRYENFERIKAILIMAKKLIVFDNDFCKIEFQTRFTYTKKEVKEPIRKQKVQIKSRSGTPEVAKKTDSNVQIENTIDEDRPFSSFAGSDVEIDDAEQDEQEDDEDDDDEGDASDASSIDEIESFILKHTTQLQSQMKDDSPPVETPVATANDRMNESSSSLGSTVHMTPKTMSSVFQSTPIFQQPMQPQQPAAQNQFMAPPFPLSAHPYQQPLFNNGMVPQTPMPMQFNPQMPPDFKQPQVAQTPQNMASHPYGAYNVFQAGNTPYYNIPSYQHYNSNGSQNRPN